MTKGGASTSTLTVLEDGVRKFDPSQKVLKTHRTPSVKQVAADFASLESSTSQYIYAVAGNLV